jgi:hypothetical protein
MELRLGRRLQRRGAAPRALHMATFAAVQRNPWLGGYYDRLMAFLKSL